MWLSRCFIFGLATLLLCVISGAALFQPAQILFGIRPAHAAEVQYVADELSRLRAVIDPNTDTAVFNYDSLGNLISISLSPASSVIIVEFLPKTGPIGTTVTIFGTGFSSVPTENTVTFNGVGATVTSATTTKIVTAVPAGATTGVIGVVSPGGSATSSQPFTVTSSSGAPTITEFTPSIANSGTPVTVTGTNFEIAPAGNSLRFNVSGSPVTSATTTTLNTTVPVSTGSGRISVITSRGRAVSSADFFIPPAPYTPADVEHTGRMSVDGSNHTLTISTPNKIGLVVFDAAVNQKVSLGVDSTDLPFFSVMKVYKPDGGILTQSVAISTSTNFHMIMPITGTYQIMVDPEGTSTGSVTLTLSSEINAGTIVVDGASVTATINRVGQRARMTFSGTTDQFVSLGVNSTVLGNNALTVLKPDGSTLVTDSAIGIHTNIHMTLPATGTYSILIDPNWDTTGSTTLTLSSEVNGGVITINGPSAPITIGRVGQRARLTFTGNEGQQATVRVTGNTMGGTTVSLLRPDQTTLTSRFSIDSSFDLTTQTLPSTGTYTILVDPDSTNTGSMNVSVTSP